MVKHRIVRFERKGIAGSNILLGILAMMLLMTFIQTTYANNGIFLNSSTNDKIVSFTISNGNDSPPIHGFIITIVDGHYSKISESPAGWSAGIIEYQAVIWTTKSHPIEPGSTESNFAIEVRQSGRYTINWTVTDYTMQPVAWGTTTITV